MIVEETENTSVGDDEETSPGMILGQGLERRQGTCHGRLGRFEAWWAAFGLEIAGPLDPDLVAGETLPFTGVIFSPAGVKFSDRTADDLSNGFTSRVRPFQIARHHGVETGTFPSQESAGLLGLFDTECREGWIGLALPTTTGIPSALSVSQDQDPSGEPCDE